jgi:AraC family transcriptional regulator, regulatory protein of adaptative response / DNA-3-methyladenine glycosylase II
MSGDLVGEGAEGRMGTPRCLEVIEELEGDHSAGPRHPGKEPRNSRPAWVLGSTAGAAPAKLHHDLGCDHEGQGHRRQGVGSDGEWRREGRDRCHHERRCNAEQRNGSQDDRSTTASIPPRSGPRRSWSTPRATTEQAGDDHVRNPPDSVTATCHHALVIEDFERCYGALKSRDSRFDGWFFTAVTSTRIYCRPSCPAKTPKPENVRFYSTSAAAQQAGFRACLRCRPDAAPGSPEWLGRADVAARAVKLILHGTVDSEGVAGLACRLGYGERQLHRVLLAEVGTGALALARAQRSQTARVLLETTDLPIAHVAFAAGFSSVRQFNDTIREIFARTPTELRAAVAKQARRAQVATSAPAPTVATSMSASPVQTISLRLAYRQPFSYELSFDFLRARAVDGVEHFDGATYRRSLNLPNGQGLASLTPEDGYVRAEFALQDLRDLTVAVARCRHLLNLDSDPIAVDEALGRDPLLEKLVARSPGLRVPGSSDGFELAVRAVVGQQVSVAGARTVASRLARAAGSPLGADIASADPEGVVTHTFPTAAALAELASRSPEAFPMPSGRRRALLALSLAIADGSITIDPGTDPAELKAKMEAIPGIGSWTSSYIAMRALGDPDVFMPTDLGVRRAASALGLTDDPRLLEAHASRWRPWRSYALFHLWSALAARNDVKPKDARRTRRFAKATEAGKGESAA